MYSISSVTIMKLVIQSHSCFMKTKSMNTLFLLKVKKLVPDVIYIIDSFLAGFAFYKLNKDSDELKKEIDILLKKNIGSYPGRIGKTILMLLMGSETSIDHEKMAEISSNVKNINLPMSDSMFQLCKVASMIEFLNIADRSYTSYSIILEGYLKCVTGTKVHVMFIDN